MENIIPIAHTRIISTHALTEGDRFPVSCTPSRRIFQLTPSRRATDNERRRRRYHYFNSRPHGGRRNESLVSELVCISTHALTEGDYIPYDYERAYREFQLTPSRRATKGTLLFSMQGGISTHALTEGDTISRSRSQCRHISTHALTEGDGKFRQIFLLNRGYAYSISLYFLPHFISLLPQILSFQQKSFKFQVRIFLLFSVHLAFALQNQCVHHVKYRFCTNMFYFVFVLFTQIVKPQTIGLFIYDFF